MVLGKRIQVNKFKLVSLPIPRWELRVYLHAKERLFNENCIHNVLLLVVENKGIKKVMQRNKSNIIRATTGTTMIYL